MVYFNDEQSSNTYMEPVTTCPGCISALFAYRVEGERVILRTSPLRSSKKFSVDVWVWGAHPRPASYAPHAP